MDRRIRWFVGTVAGLFLFLGDARGQDAVAGVRAEAHGTAHPVPRIRDNLLVLEEAYNQEPGVVQHVLLFGLRPKNRDWTMAFTDEWPVLTDRHQVSLTLNLAGGHEGVGIALSEVLVNWRIQVLGLGGVGPVALAPRLGLLIPTGPLARGGSRGVFGVQGNLPLSIEAGRWMVIHLNGGLTITPGAMIGGARKTLWEPSAGVALVGQPLPWFNLLLEGLFVSREDVDQGRWKREHGVTVAPGVRFAVDRQGVGLQVVPALAASLDFRIRRGFRVERDFWAGLMVYLSIEHRAFEVR